MITSFFSRYRLLLSVGILTMPFVVSAEVSIFTGDREADWKLVRGAFLQNPADPGQCDPQTLYLENVLNAPKVVSTQATGAFCWAPDRADSTLQNIFGERSFSTTVLKKIAVDPKDVACIAAAQKYHSVSVKAKTPPSEPTLRWSNKSPTYVSCDPQTNYSAPQPCRSEAYVSAMAVAFNSVTDCLGANPREVFKVFAHESGMQFNVISHTGAAGVSQMTPSAILHVQYVEDGLEGSRASRELATKFKTSIHGHMPLITPDPKCSTLKDLEIPRFESKREAKEACALVNPQAGLELSTFYGVKHYLYYKSEIEAFARERNLKKIFGKDCEEIMQVAAMYSFSAAGHYAAFPAFKALSLSYARDYKPLGAPAGKKKFLADLKARIIDKRPSVKGELEHYISGSPTSVEERYNDIKKRMGGGECF